MRRETRTDSMTHCTMRYALALTLVLAAGSGLVLAQKPGPEDQAIDQIRRLATIAANDQQRIHDWIMTQVGKFTDFSAFRKRIADQFTHSSNSAQFPSALATQTAAVAVAQAGSPRSDPGLGRALAQALYDMNRPETFPGYVALIASKDSVTRYLSAAGLAMSSVKRAIAADPAKLNQAVAALRKAGSTETDPVVVGRIYEALAHPGQTANVFDAYMAILDRRVTLRRRPGTVADGAEQFAYAFFAGPNVTGALNTSQKAELTKRMAVLMRLDGERYNTPGLEFGEADRIERTLWSAEDILSSSAMLGSKGGKIRTALQAGGQQNSAAVLEEVYKWVGHSASGTQGALNAAPWSVPVGAP